MLFCYVREIFEVERLNAKFSPQLLIFKMSLLSDSILLDQNWTPLSDSFSPFCLCRLCARPALKPFFHFVPQLQLCWLGFTRLPGQLFQLVLNLGFPRLCLFPDHARTALSAAVKPGLSWTLPGSWPCQDSPISCWPCPGHWGAQLWAGAAVSAGAVRTGSLRYAAAPSSGWGWLEAQQWLLQSWVFHAGKDHPAEEFWRNGVRALQAAVLVMMNCCR